MFLSDDWFLARGEELEIEEEHKFTIADYAGATVMLVEHYKNLANAESGFVAGILLEQYGEDTAKFWERIISDNCRVLKYHTIKMRKALMKDGDEAKEEIIKFLQEGGVFKKYKKKYSIRRKK